MTSLGSPGGLVPAYNNHEPEQRPVVAEMRILTVRQPWAQAIAEGVKLTENRPLNIAGDWRGPIAIHAGAQWDNHAFDFPPLAEWVRRRWGITRENQTGTDLPTRSIIAVAKLWAVHRAQPGNLCCPNNEKWTHWGQPEGWHLCLSDDVVRLANPIPYKGALGLRRLPADVASAVRADLPAPLFDIGETP